MVRRDRNHPCVVMWSTGNEVREMKVQADAPVSQMLTDIIHKQFGGISMKTNGGLYFIAEEHVSKWKDVIMVVEAAAVEPTANDLSVVPLEMNEMTLRDIKRSITREIESAAERLRTAERLASRFARRPS